MGILTDLSNEAPTLIGSDRVLGCSGGEISDTVQDALLPEDLAGIDANLPRQRSQSHAPTASN